MITESARLLGCRCILWTLWQKVSGRMQAQLLVSRWCTPSPRFCPGVASSPFCVPITAQRTLGAACWTQQSSETTHFFLISLRFLYSRFSLSQWRTVISWKNEFTKSRMYLESIFVTKSLIYPVQLGKAETQFLVSSIIVLYSFSKHLYNGCHMPNSVLSCFKNTNLHSSYNCPIK